MAHDRLGAAHAAVAARFYPNAVSAASYAMLYAARAALSEEDRNAKTHSGTWNLFRETFVVDGRFDSVLFAQAHGTQKLREAADYDALMVPQDEAERIVGLADRFIAAVAALVGA